MQLVKWNRKGYELWQLIIILLAIVAFFMFATWYYFKSGDVKILIKGVTLFG